MQTEFPRCPCLAYRDALFRSGRKCLGLPESLTRREISGARFLKRELRSLVVPPIFGVATLVTEPRSFDSQSLPGMSVCVPWELRERVK